MLSSGERHLTEHELDDYADFQLSSPRSAPYPDGDLDSLTQHVSQCSHCRSEVDKRLAVSARMAQLRTAAPTERMADCPTNEKWREVAAHLVDPATELRMLDHAAACDYCGPQLRIVVEHFADEMTADETALIASLSSSTENGRRLLLERISASRGGQKQEHRKYPLWIFTSPRWAIAATVFLIAGILFTWNFLHRPEFLVPKLLAQAYTEQPPFDLRLPYADYAPPREDRGSVISRYQLPASLLAAEGIIGENLKKRPTDPFWLQARARSELLEGLYEDAIVSLEQAIGSNDKMASLRVDLGSAYYMRGLSKSRTSDFAASIEQYSKALSEVPNDPVAIYNRALAEEQLQLYDRAILDWKTFLRLEPTGGWADEARKNFAKLQKLVDDQKANGGTGMAAIEGDVATSSDPNLITDNIEAYFTIAETRWLPALYASRRGMKTPAPDSSEPLRILATLSREKHQDDWLFDLLRASPSPALTEGLSDLADSLNADDQGDYLRSLEKARLAEELFKKGHIRSGEERAEVQEIRALRLADLTTDCLQLSRSLSPVLMAERYPRLLAQLQLEHAICLDLLGNEGSAQSMAQKAQKTASDAHYQTLHLRSLTVEAGLAAATGRLESGWKLSQAGLRLYWGGNFPSMRRYSLLDVMELMADDSHDWLLQFAVLNESVIAIDTDPDLMLRAVAHDQLAHSAFRTGLLDVAHKEFQEADQLFEMCPKNRVTDSRQADEEIWLAQSEVEQGQYESATRRLAGVRQRVLSNPYRYGLDHYYQAAGELALRQGYLAEAESTFRSAVLLAEAGLKSLKSERDRTEWSREHSNSYRSLVDLHLRQHDDPGAFSIWEWYKAAPLRSADSDSRVPPLANPALPSTNAGDRSPWPDLETVQKQTSQFKNDTTISFAFLPNSLVVWTFDAHGIQTKLLSSSPNEIQERIASFERACATPSSDPVTLRGQGRALYDLLIAPIADRLTPDGVLILEGDGAVAELPFQALIDREGHYFGDRYDLIWSEGIHYRTRLRPSLRFSPSLSVLAVAVPESESPSARVPLPDVVAEATLVASKFRSSKLLIGPDASVSRVKRELPNKFVFHFAGHAVAGSAGAELLMGNDGEDQLTSQVLVADDLKPEMLKHLQLAVLAACATEMGTTARANVPESLVRVLLRAGVPHVLATRWNLDSRAASNFTSTFYDELLAGETPARAAREAAAKLRSSQETAHPYYWAGLNIFGTL